MVKYARSNTGEDWSEKLAFELGRTLCVPCPLVDLVEVVDRRGVLCWDFLTASQSHHPDGARESSLIHGNELLFQLDAEYPTEKRYGVPKHTLSAVERVLTGCLPRTLHPAQDATFHDGFDTFIGYLMLDALVGNTDRHHENWGVVTQRVAGGHTRRIAPSYDHASSLGRELDDIKRQGRLDSSGRGTIADYANKAKSAFWSSDGRKLTVLEVFREAAALRHFA
jgi:hypothetical protein